MADGLKIGSVLGVLVMLAGLFSCGSGEKPPGDILEKDQVVHAIIELYITEEKIRTLNLPGDSARKFFDQIDEKIFEDLGMSDTALKKSLRYYMQDPHQLEEIYSAVVDSLNLMEQRAPSPEGK